MRLRHDHTANMLLCTIYRYLHRIRCSSRRGNLAWYTRTGYRACIGNHKWHCVLVCSGKKEGANLTNTRTKARKEKYAAVLALLNEPGGRAMANTRIAKLCKTNAQFVQTVRDANRTPEEQEAYERKREANLKALDSVFPGIYEFYYPKQIGD